MNSPVAKGAEGDPLWEVRRTSAAQAAYPKGYAQADDGAARALDGGAGGGPLEAGLAGDVGAGGRQMVLEGWQMARKGFWEVETQRELWRL